MFILLPGHFGEEFRRGREIPAERFSEIAIDPSILFLRRDGEGKDLRFVQVMEVHGSRLDVQRDAPVIAPRILIEIRDYTL